MAGPPGIIDLDNSRESDSDNANGFLPPPVNCRNSAESLDVDLLPAFVVSNRLERQPVSSFDSCLKIILEIFPDISHERVRELYDRQVGNPDPSQNFAQQLIEQILEGGKYPKERERLRELKELKRKREDKDSDDEEAARWSFADLRDHSIEYAKVAKVALQEAFPFVPAKYIDERFREHGHYFGAYFAIATAERQSNGAQQNPYVRLKFRRYNAGYGSEDLMAHLQIQGHDFGRLKQEMDAVRRRRVKADLKAQEETRAAREIEARDQEHREKGEVMECACCFDEATIANITHCNGDTPHFFCYSCARMNANSDVGNNRYELQCMDGSGCKATFSRKQREKFLDERTIEKLEQLQQQSELRSAGLQNFVTCPFCNYGHICPPVEEDREFRCEMPDCKEVSCRLCKERSHIPLSCQEYRKENGMSERRVIEEARTEALIRTCHKCKLRIMKIDGCNKVVCTGCYSVICDYCGKDITKIKYGHFDGQGRGPPGTEPEGGKCPLYDESDNRKDKQIEEAGKAAMEEIRKDNPGISEEDLKIKFSKEVEAKKNSNGRHHYHGFPPHEILLQIPPYGGQARAGLQRRVFAERAPEMLPVLRPLAGELGGHNDRRREGIQRMINRMGANLQAQMQERQEEMRQRLHEALIAQQRAILEHRERLFGMPQPWVAAPPAPGPFANPPPDAQQYNAIRPFGGQSPFVAGQAPAAAVVPNPALIAAPNHVPMRYHIPVSGVRPSGVPPTGNAQPPPLIPGFPDPPLAPPARLDPQFQPLPRQGRQQQHQGLDGAPVVNFNNLGGDIDRGFNPGELDFNAFPDEADDPRRGRGGWNLW